MNAGKKLQLSYNSISMGCGNSETAEDSSFPGNYDSKMRKEINKLSAEFTKKLRCVEAIKVIFAVDFSHSNYKSWGLSTDCDSLHKPSTLAYKN